MIFPLLKLCQKRELIGCSFEQDFVKDKAGDAKGAAKDLAGKG